MVQIYELYDCYDGNDDILSDIGNVSQQERYGMWGLIPYGVDDGTGVINEDFISFVLNRKVYPNTFFPNFPFVVLVKNFNDCISNLKETLNKVKNKRQFYTNLLALQEYLIQQKQYNEPFLLSEEGEIPQTQPNVIPYSLENKEEADMLAKAFAQRLNLGQPSYLGGGGFGFAYLVNNNKILKFTTDIGEMDAAVKIKRGKPQTLANVYNTYKVINTENGNAYYAIMMEYIANKPIQEFVKYVDIINQLAPSTDIDWGGMLITMRKNFNYNTLAETAKYILTNKPEANIRQEDRQNAYNFLLGILAIKQELINLGIPKSNDYSNLENLGYRNGVLVHFDIGAYKAEQTQVPPENVITLPESVKLTENYTYLRLPEEIINQIVTKIGEKFPITKLEYIGSGGFGDAYDIGNDKVMKLTSDPTEATENLELIGNNLKHIANPYAVFKIQSKSQNETFYAIILEKLTLNNEHIQSQMKRLRYAFEEILNVQLKRILIGAAKGNMWYYQANKDIINAYFNKNSQDKDFFDGLLHIANEIYDNGIQSTEFTNFRNLGYKKDGTLAFFDLGFADQRRVPSIQPQSVEVDEDGSSKFSTDTALGQDEYPSYNPIDTSPSIDNNIPTSVDEDLEYNHIVGDTTKDQYEISEERKKSWMPGSQAVTVKKKCRLGGLGNTSVACNQGDINNLELTKINETQETEYGTYYRVVSEFMGTDVEFQPKGEYEAVDDEGNPIIKYDMHVKSNVGEVAASRTIGGAVMGLYSMLKMHNQPINYFYVYEINDKPDIDISHWSSFDFNYLQEVRFRKPVKGKYIGKIRLNDDIMQKLDAYYEVIGSEDFGQPIYDPEYERASKIVQNTDYDTLLSGMKTSVHENLNETQMSIRNLPFKREIEAFGGEIYMVGGSTRDEIIGYPSKDLDIVIRKIPEDKLAQILIKYGRVNPVGKSFSVVKFTPRDSDEEIDIALPRTEISTGVGHKDFVITADPNIPIEKDLERRDFTINAIAKDMQGNYIDPFNGIKDIENGIIRIPYDKSFEDDPLRMLRAIRFAARYHYDIDPETLNSIKQNADKIRTIAKDRIQGEFEKFLENPQMSAYLLKETGLLKELGGGNTPLSVGDRWQFVKTLPEFIYLLVYNSVQSPVDFYKRTMRGDINVINDLTGLMMGMNYTNLTSDPLKNRILAHNMAIVSKNPNILKSKILPIGLYKAGQELLLGKYPLTYSKMAINGDDIKKILNIPEGKEVGKILNQLLLNIYADKVRNNRDELLNLLSK